MKLYFILYLFFAVKLAHSQELNGVSRNIVSPSPEAAGFTKYGNIPVSNYTGVPNISIPIFDVAIRDINFSMTLSYHSYGIQVEEEAGWTGLGWNLNVGGVITREIRGLDDLRTIRNGSNIPFASFSYQGYPFDPEIPQTTPVAKQYITDVCRKGIDPEPDIFYYNFLGQSGSFILPKQSSSGQEIVALLLTPDKIKIVFNKQNRQWIIKTKDGFTYYFSTNEVQEIRRYEQPSLFGEQQCINYYPESSMLNSEGYYHNSEDINITAWYMDKAVSVTGDSLNFIYDLFIPPGGGNVQRSRYGSTKITFNDIESKTSNLRHQGSGTTCLPNCFESKIRDFFRTFTAHIYLKEVRFRNGSIEFATSDRIDMRPANNGIVYPFNGMLKSSIATSVSKGPQKLDNITIRDLDGKLVKRFKFEYSYFNNGVSNLPDFTIKRLKLLLVQEISSDGVSGLPPYKFFYNEATSLPVKYSRAIDFWGYYNGVETNLSRVPKGIYTPSGSAPIVLGDANRNPSAAYIGSGTIREIEYPTGGRSVFEFEPHDYFYFGQGVFDLTENLPNGVPVNSEGIQAKMASGLRIKKIVNYAISGEIATQKIFKYISDDGRKSSGRLMIFPAFHTLEGVYGDLLHHYNGCSYFATTFSGKSSSYLPYANSAQGSIVGYDKVTIQESINSASSGYSEFFYDNQVESVGSSESSFFGTIPNKRYKSNGNLLKKRVFNGNSQRLLEDVYTYEGQLKTEIPALAFRKTLEGVVVRIGITNVDISCHSVQSHERFFIPSERYVLRQVISKSYNNGETITTTAKSVFDSESHLQLKSTEFINSKNETAITNYLYTNNASWIPTSIVSDKYIYAPVLISKLINQKPINAQKKWYTVSPSGFASVNKEEYAFGNNAFELLGQVTQFDNIGNPITILKKDAVPFTYIWGYNSQYPIAEVTGSAASSVAYTSFESNDKGGWVYNYVGRPSVGAVTGRRSLSLNSRDGSTISRENLLAGGKYIISYWSGSTSPYTITGGTIVNILGKTINGWTYHEHKITATSTTLTITGSGDIDEVRLYPASAVMTTYTYDPLIGMTSQCDINNRITYYEYDGFQRLILIRDQDRNIIKRICYNYAGQPEDCGANTSPNWQATGTTRCQPCAANTSYTNNIRERQERDNNTSSPTYNQLRWVSEGVNAACTITPVWTNTATAIRCKKNASNVNTGEQEQEQKDMNPCSTTYNQLRWIVTGTNTTACPLACNTSNCTGANKKCINGVCQTGTRVNTGSYHNGSQYVCTFHYEWTDGTRSSDIYETNSYGCPVY